jgi:CheY-like chemotaxis protein
VVDDNIDGAVMLGQLLELMGHDVQIAHEAGQALSLLDAYVPELAILDIGLPGMDGYDLAAAIQQRQPQCKLVALTGYGQEGDRARSEAAGFAQHLVKPVGGGQLREVLRTTPRLPHGKAE